MRRGMSRDVSREPQRHFSGASAARKSSKTTAKQQRKYSSPRRVSFHAPLSPRQIPDSPRFADKMPGARSRENELPFNAVHSGDNGSIAPNDLRKRARKGTKSKETTANALLRILEQPGGTAPATKDLLLAGALHAESTRQHVLNAFIEAAKSLGSIRSDYPDTDRGRNRARSQPKPRFQQTAARKQSAFMSPSSTDAGATSDSAVGTDFRRGTSFSSPFAVGKLMRFVDDLADEQEAEEIAEHTMREAAGRNNITLFPPPVGRMVTVHTQTTPGLTTHGRQRDIATQTTPQHGVLSSAILEDEANHNAGPCVDEPISMDISTDNASATEKERRFAARTERSLAASKQSSPGIAHSTHLSQSKVSSPTTPGRDQPNAPSSSGKSGQDSETSYRISDLEQQSESSNAESEHELKILNWRKTGVDDRGAQDLFKGLINAYKVAANKGTPDADTQVTFGYNYNVIDVRDNAIGDEGCLYVARFIAFLLELRDQQRKEGFAEADRIVLPHIAISGNPITDVGRDYLIDALYNTIQSNGNDSADISSNYQSDIELESAPITQVHGVSSIDALFAENGGFEVGTDEIDQQLDFIEHSDDTFADDAPLTSRSTRVHSLGASDNQQVQKKLRKSPKSLGISIGRRQRRATQHIASSRPRAKALTTSSASQPKTKVAVVAPKNRQGALRVHKTLSLGKVIGGRAKQYANIQGVEKARRKTQLESRKILSLGKVTKVQLQRPNKQFNPPGSKSRSELSRASASDNAPLFGTRWFLFGTPKQFSKFNIRKLIKRAGGSYQTDATEEPDDACTHALFGDTWIETEPDPTANPAWRACQANQIHIVNEDFLSAISTNQHERR